MIKSKTQRNNLINKGLYITAFLFTFAAQTQAVASPKGYSLQNDYSTDKKNSNSIAKNKDITAADSICYTLKTSVSGKGSISPGDSAFTKAAAATIMLTAIPEKGWKFQKWSGSLSGSNNPETLTIDSNASVSASFIEDKTVTNSGPSCSFYPIPAEYKLIMELRNDFSTGVVFQLVDSDGMLIINEEVAGTRHELDVSKINPGIYLIKLTNSNNKTITKRITIS